MSRELSLQECFASANKRRRYSDEEVVSSALSSPPVLTLLSSISLSTATALEATMVPTPSQITLSTTEPTTPPVFQLQATVSSSSPSKNSQLSIVDEQNPDVCVSPVVSSNPTVVAPSFIDVYDPNDIGHFVAISITKQDATRIYDMLKRPWTPSLSFKYAKIDLKGHSRSVCIPKWLVDFPWLSYSAKLNGVLCRYCVLFRRTSSYADPAENQLGQLVNKPLSGTFLKEATTYLKNHEKTQYHKYSATQANEFIIRRIDPYSNVDNLLNLSNQNQQNENRKVLLSIVKCLLFLADQNMALRGHDDDGLPCDVNPHQDNFKNLIAFRAEAGNTVLAKHLQTCAKNASYLSLRIQNELILLSAQIVRAKLIRKLIEKRLFPSLLADETSDISGCEQLSISVRYVSSETDASGEFIHEVCLGFIPLENPTAIAVANKMCEFLKNIGLSIDLIGDNILD